VFQVDCPSDVNLSLPKGIWNLRPSIVITTNYEDVLQWANAGSQRMLNDQHAELVDLFRASTPDRPIVWHLHGHIS
jgi:hypothetical protein